MLLNIWDSQKSVFFLKGMLVKNWRSYDNAVLTANFCIYNEDLHNKDGLFMDYIFFPSKIEV